MQKSSTVQQSSLLKGLPFDKFSVFKYEKVKDHHPKKRKLAICTHTDSMVYRISASAELLSAELRMQFFPDNESK